MAGETELELRIRETLRFERDVVPLPITTADLDARLALRRRARARRRLEWAAAAVACLAIAVTALVISLQLPGGYTGPGASRTEAPSAASPGPSERPSEAPVETPHLSAEAATTPLPGIEPLTSSAGREVMRIDPTAPEDRSDGTGHAGIGSAETELRVTLECIGDGTVRATTNGVTTSLTCEAGHVGQTSQNVPSPNQSVDIDYHASGLISYGILVEVIAQPIGS